MVGTKKVLRIVTQPLAVVILSVLAKEAVVVVFSNNTSNNTGIVEIIVGIVMVVGVC